jgi:hypothetical protein
MMIVVKDTESAGAGAALPALSALPSPRGCGHQPTCPTADATDREAASLVVSHPEQGWGLLCNGVVLFDDTGELLPDGRAVAPHRIR